MHRRPSAFSVSSLKAALDAFLRAPATGGYHNNEGVVLAVMGAKETHAEDCPTFDAVRLKYEVPKACTFERAFKACWHGSRDWRDFDIETLRDAHPLFHHLQLPARVEDALEREAISGEHERRVGESVAASEEGDEALPPIELLYRAGPKGRRRRSRGPTQRSRACKGSRNACSKNAAAKKYRAAKKAYHAAGEQLRRIGLKRGVP